MNLPAYPAYQESGVEWLGAIPAHWISIRLKFAADLIDEKVDGESAPTAFIGLEHIESWTGALLEDQESKSSGIVNSFRSGDVLFGKLRPYLAKVHVATKMGVCTGEALVLRPGENLDARFLFYTLVTPQVIENINASTYGAKMPRANWTFIGDQIQLLPPIEEQKTISLFLDRETARIDALIEKKRKLLELLEEKRLAVITQAVTKGLGPDVPMKDSGIEWLGEVPAHWEVKVPLNYIVQAYGGCTPSTANAEYWGGDIPWVSPKDMKTDNLFDSEDHVAERAMEDTSLRLLPCECILIVVRGMILAHSFPVALNKIPVTINQDMKALVCDRRVLPNFLGWYLRGLAKHILSLVESSAHGTKALRTEQWQQLIVPILPLDEQRVITGHIEAETTRIKILMKKIDKQIMQLQEYRAALITNAVTGKIDVRKMAEKENSAA